MTETIVRYGTAKRSIDVRRGRKQKQFDRTNSNDEEFQEEEWETKTKRNSIADGEQNCCEITLN